MRKVIPPFLLGFTALSFQITLMREFVVHFFGNEITIGLFLGTWLFWGGLGSILAYKIKFSLNRFLNLYHLVIGLFVLCLFGLRFSRFILGSLPGEQIGIIPLLATAFIVSVFSGFPLGLLFVFNILYAKGQLAQVYILESLGSAAAGLLLNFLLIPYFSNWQMASILGVFISLTFFISCRKFRSLPLFLATTAVMAVFWFADIPSQKTYWSPLSLVESKDTVYGTIHVLKTEEQISLYNNSVPIYSYPGLYSAEELTHFPLLHKPDAKNVLLIGSGSGEELRQILKYPYTQVDCIELNPEILRLSFSYLPEAATEFFRDPRVRLHIEDGVVYLNRTTQKFDAILLNLPDPSSALINRFFTREFFLLVKKNLHPGGVLSFRVSSAENYISDELQNYLSSLYFTLKSVFSDVEIIPGDTNIFLASADIPPIDFFALSEGIRSLKLNTTFVSPELLSARLNPLRVSNLKDIISSGEKKINLDLAPISYYFNSVLWSKQFKSFEARFFSGLSRLSSFWLLDIPLLLFVLILIGLGLKRNLKSSFYLTPLIVMGLTTLMVEVIVIIGYQTVHGFLYKSIALLFSFFMLGLCVGAIFGQKKKVRYSHLIHIQALLILLIAVLIYFIQNRPPEIFFFAFLFLLGLSNGALFVVSNQLYFKEKKNFGLGYGLDLMGAFVGAVATSAFLIPLLGFPLLLKYVLLLNSFCLLFITWGFLKGVR